MPDVTYFVALPFIQGDGGDLIAGNAIECLDASRAVREAEHLSRLNAGAVAFSRTGDPALGEFQEKDESYQAIWRGTRGRPIRQNRHTILLPKIGLIKDRQWPRLSTCSHNGDTVK